MAPKAYGVHLPFFTIAGMEDLRFHMPGQGVVTIAATTPATSVQPSEQVAQDVPVLRRFVVDLQGRAVSNSLQGLMPGLYLEVTATPGGVQAESVIVDP